MGLPHSVFLSWSQLDQDKALMYVRQMATVCERCRTRRSEWDADPDAYIGSITVCEGCGRLDDEGKNVEDGDTRGVRIGLLPHDIAMMQMEQQEPK